MSLPKRIDELDTASQASVSLSAGAAVAVVTGGKTIQTSIGALVPAGSNIVSVKDPQFGAKGDGVTDDTAAIQAAVTSLTSGGYVIFPIGTYKITSTITIVVNGTVLKVGNSIISFVPSGAGAAFSFTAGASILYYCGIEDAKFISSDTTFAKDMVRATDVSFFHATGLTSDDNTWTGNTSVGIRLRGREEIRIRDCRLSTDKPLVVEANPNFATNMLDISSVEKTLMVVTSALTNPCVDFTGSGAISNIAFRDVSFNLGAGAIKCNLTAATASQIFEIDNCRNEQTVGTTQFAYDFANSGGGNIQGLSIKNCLFDPALGGIKLRNCSFVTLSEIVLISTTKTNLDVDGTVTSLTLENFSSATGGTISGLASVLGLMRIGYVIGATLPVSGFQRLIADAIPTAPTIAAGFTGLGASGTAAVDAGSNDFAGTITLSPAGAGTAGVGNVTLTFNSVYVGTPIVVACGAIGSTTWVDGPVMQVQPTTGVCLIRWMNGPASVALTAGQTYKIAYVVIGK